MLQCSNCHADAADGANFCLLCGAQLDPAMATLASVPAMIDAAATALSAGQEHRTLPRTDPAAAATPERKGRPLQSWLAIGALGALGLAVLVAGVLGIIQTARSGAPVTQASAPTQHTPIPTNTPQPTLDSGSFHTQIFKETFDNPQQSSFDVDESDDAVFAFENGMYAITLKRPKYILWSQLEETYGDAAVEVDATLTGPKESTAGLIFHYQDSDNFYIFNVAGNGYYELNLYKESKLIVLIDWTESPAVKGLGKTNRLRVETEQNRIRLFVNGQLLDEASDATFTKGKIALAVSTFEKSHATVRFDNLIVLK